MAKTARPKTTGMGRGLSAILAASESGKAAVEDRGDELRQLSVDVVAPNPNQPRRSFDEDSLRALADSLGDRGVLQPVLVRPVAGGTYELVAGERRWRAAKLAGLDKLPAIIAERDDARTLEDALIENMAREDLNPVEEARAVAGLVEELGLTREAVGRKVGRSRVAISNLLRLLDLPEEALEYLQEGALSEGHGRALLLASDHSDRKRLAREAVEGDWSVRVTEQRSRDANETVKPATKGRAAIHPDQQTAMTHIADALGAALGTDVKVRPRGTGYKVELSFADASEAVELARRVAR